MLSPLEYLAMAEEVLLQEQTETTWAGIHFIRKAREQWAAANMTAELTSP